MGGCLLLVIQTGGMAAVTITFARYLSGIDRDGNCRKTRLSQSHALTLLTIINCLGVKLGSRVQSILMLLKICAIAMLVMAGMFLVRAPQPLLHPVLDRAPSLDLLSCDRGSHGAGAVCSVRRMADDELRRGGD